MFPTCICPGFKKTSMITKFQITHLSVDGHIHHQTFRHQFVDHNLIMSGRSTGACTCTSEGYSPECPQTFMQGGKMLHVLDGETQLKPRLYENTQGEVEVSRSDDGRLNVMQYLDDNTATSPDTMTSIPEDHTTTHISRVEPLRMITIEREMKMTPRLVTEHTMPFDTDYGLQLNQRATLDKFEPLRVGSTSFTEASIGGFQMNIEKVREKIEAYVPLPPAILPKIFIDPNLNFYHHFMQGLEILAGREYITRVMSKGTYADNDKGKILPALKSLVIQGHKIGDTELTVFIKRVLCSTFDTIPTIRASGDTEAFIVAANLYGFPYIEAGMTCRESDVKMWLHMTYTQYKMAWFNNFKSSGIPAFALEGVQDRYISNTLAQSSKPRSALRIDDIPSKDQYRTQTRRREHSIHRGERLNRRETYPIEAAPLGFWNKVKSLAEVN